MGRNLQSWPDAATENACDANIPNVRAIAVGDPAEWQLQGNMLPSEGVMFVALEDVTADLISRMPAVTVLSPILGKGFDCIDLALLLNKMGFDGAYRAIACDVPMPRMIEQEVRQLCPQLDFRITENC